MNGKRNVFVALIITSLMFVSFGINAQTKFTLNKQGVGCLKKGMLFSKIPAKCDGLYDRFEKQVIEDEMDGDYTVYSFYLGKEKTADITTYGDPAISSITVYTSNVSTPDGVNPGMPLKKLLTMKGVKGVYNDGFGLTLNGYTIGFGEMTEHGYKVFNDAYAKGTDVKLSNACFKEGDKVLYITF